MTIPRMIWAIAMTDEDGETMYWKSYGDGSYLWVAFDGMPNKYTTEGGAKRMLGIIRRELDPLRDLRVTTHPQWHIEQTVRRRTWDR